MDNHVGYRYLMWNLTEEKTLPPEQRFRCLNAFIKEFEALPRHQEAYPGWGAVMVKLLRKCADGYRPRSLDAEDDRRPERDDAQQHQPRGREGTGGRY